MASPLTVTFELGLMFNVVEPGSVVGLLKPDTTLTLPPAVTFELSI
jgi:hypothetical protein